MTLDRIELLLHVSKLTPGESRTASETGDNVSAAPLGSPLRTVPSHGCRLNQAGRDRRACTPTPTGGDGS